MKSISMHVFKTCICRGKRKFYKEYVCNYIACSIHFQVLLNLSSYFGRIAITIVFSEYAFPL